jgi:hypothetical protein
MGDAFSLFLLAKGVTLKKEEYWLKEKNLLSLLPKISLISNYYLNLVLTFFKRKNIRFSRLPTYN